MVPYLSELFGIMVSRSPLDNLSLPFCHLIEGLGSPFATQLNMVISPWPIKVFLGSILKSGGPE
jgi:hypothetical protein